MNRRLALILMGVVWAAPAFGAKQTYVHSRVGSALDKVGTTTTAGTVLMGGGTDVDAAFQWMCGQSGGGDFLVLRATGTGAYNPYIHQLRPGANSVATLVVSARAGASDPFVVNAVENAEAVWIAGGDQSDYINEWKGTPLSAALQTKVGKAPVGGTSAGMNVLTQFVISALLSQGVTSSQVLANPYTKYLTLDRDFVSVPELAGMIGDPHFVERDRLGRDLAFLCRISNNGWPGQPRAVAVDAATALEVDSRGTATLVGAGTAYFLRAPGAPQVCQEKQPLTYLGVQVYRIGGGGSFDLTSWRGAGGTAYEVSAENGVLTSTQAGGAIY